MLQHGRSDSQPIFWAAVVSFAGDLTKDANSQPPIAMLPCLSWEILFSTDDRTADKSLPPLLPHVECSLANQAMIA
jgi:hypothetical protein